MGVPRRNHLRGTADAARHAGGPWPRHAPPQGPNEAGPWSRWIAGINSAVIAVVALTYFFDWRHGQPFPESGTAHWYTTAQEPRVALLRLAAPSHTRSHFAVRLDDWASGAPVVLIHVRGGESSATLMPLGRYRVTIAKGSKWQGPGRLFGMGGEVREAVDPVEFYRSEREVMGHRIELESLVGNMPMQPGKR